MTCPSASTPEGKAKIEQITSHLNAVKAQIKKADTAPAGPLSTTSPTTMGDDRAPASSDPVTYTVDGRFGSAVRGNSLNTYA